jgi:hypothetical protein
MTSSRDFDGSHRIDDYPQRFSSEADAQAAIEFALDLLGREAGKESRYRRAARRSQGESHAG